MSRPLRIDYPDIYYHVLSRGNEQRPIFQSEQDYEKFLELLEKTVGKFQIEIHAYMLMKNHYHLLVKTTEEGNLSRAIQWLGVSYSVWYNRRHRRTGHLFQGRFKSFLVEDDRYFTAMCYYIHGNPVRVGASETAEEFSWSSALAYTAKAKEPSWLTTSLILSISGGRRKFCRNQAIYLSRGDSPLNDLRYGVYLGSAEYAQRCAEMSRCEVGVEKPGKKRLMRYQRKEDVACWILKRLGEEDIEAQLLPGKKQRPSRNMCIYLMSRMGAYTHKEIGEMFGVGYTAVTGMIKRVEGLLLQDKHKNKLAAEILNEII